MVTPSSEASRAPEASLFFPSFERAIAEGVRARVRPWWRPSTGVDLLRRRPAAYAGLAALALDARVQTRRAFERPFVMSERAAGALPTIVPPAPRAFARADHRVLVEPVGPARRCETCVARPGRALCAACSSAGGPGFAFADPDLCPRCAALPALCPVCEGTCRAVDVRVLDVSDRARALAYVFVPSLPFELDAGVTRHLEARWPPPPALRFELDAPARGGPYRAARQGATEGRWGYDFGDAVGRAQRALETLGADGQVGRRQVAAYAWPLLWARYALLGANAELVLFVDPAGRHRAVADIYPS
jgi:hypothetical protein